MLIAWITIVRAIIGALLYALSPQPKASELGRLLFAAAIFATCFQLATRTLRLG